LKGFIKNIFPPINKLDDNVWHARAQELGWCACDVIGQLSQLESLELGECTFRAEFAGVLGRLARLRRLRLERGTAQCAAPALLRALATLPLLTRLELVNVDVKVAFFFHALHYLAQIKYL
jgi:hypothetical protein